MSQVAPLVLLALFFLVQTVSSAAEWEEPPPAVMRLLVGSAPRPGVGYSLAALVAEQRKSYAHAQVTSGFSDPRGVSRYRSHPGLHLGYDVAMPRGAPVRAVWPGRVEDVIPWCGVETGVRVRHPDGSCATYGHIVPLVRVGAEVETGQALGTVAVDHVDVKMRDAAGAPLDFGAGTAVVDWRSQWLEVLRQWAWLRQRTVELEFELNRRPGALRPPRPTREAIAVYLQEGILSPRQARQARERLDRYEREVARAQKSLLAARQELERLRALEPPLRRQCQSWQAKAHQAGYDWARTEAYLRSRS